MATESFSINAIKYPQCKHIKRTKPNVAVSEDQIQSFILEADVLPIFEERLQDYKRIKHYSLRTNQHLNCHWKAFLKSLDEVTVKTAYEYPNVNDFHFHNHLIKYQPQDNKLISNKLKLRCGPGVDFFGQMPIPENMHKFRKGSLSRPNSFAEKGKIKPNVSNLKKSQLVLKTEEPNKEK